MIIRLRKAFSSHIQIYCTVFSILCKPARYRGLRLCLHKRTALWHEGSCQKHGLFSKTTAAYSCRLTFYERYYNSFILYFIPAKTPAVPRRTAGAEPFIHTRELLYKRHSSLPGLKTDRCTAVPGSPEAAKAESAHDDAGRSHTFLPAAGG